MLSRTTGIPSSYHAAAAGTASALDAGDAVRVVVVGQFLALLDAARGDDPDRMFHDVDITVGVARVIDVAPDVAPDRRIARPARVDREDPDALPWQVAVLAPPAFSLRHQFSLVFDDAGFFLDGLAGVDPPARDW